jgi:hypothetical protein
MLRAISFKDDLHENSKSWFDTTSDPSSPNDEFFSFLQQRVTGSTLTLEESRRTLNLIQTSTAWQETGIPPIWLTFPPQTSLNVPISPNPTSLLLTLGDMGITNTKIPASRPSSDPAENFDSLSMDNDASDPTDIIRAASPSSPIIQSRAPDAETDVALLSVQNDAYMEIANTENSCQVMRLEDDPTPPSSPSLASPPTDIEGRAPYPAEKSSSLSADDDTSDPTDIMLAARPSSAIYVIQSRAPDAETDVAVSSVQDDASHSLSPPPGIIKWQADNAENLSVDGDDEDQDNDAVKSLAYTLNKAIDMNASQDGLEASTNNPPLIKPAQNIQKIWKEARRKNRPLIKPAKIGKKEIIDLTLEEVSFNTILGWYFHKSLPGTLA